MHFREPLPFHPDRPPKRGRIFAQSLAFCLDQDSGLSADDGARGASCGCADGCLERSTVERNGHRAADAGDRETVVTNDVPEPRPNVVVGDLGSQEAKRQVAPRRPHRPPLGPVDAHQRQVLQVRAVDVGAVRLAAGADAPEPQGPPQSSAGHFLRPADPDKTLVVPWPGAGRLRLAPGRVSPEGRGRGTRGRGGVTVAVENRFG